MRDLIAVLTFIACCPTADAGWRHRRAPVVQQPCAQNAPATTNTNFVAGTANTASASSFDPSGFLTEVNRVRSQHGLASLGWSDAAYGHASRNAGIVARTRGRLWHPGGGGYEIAARNQSDIAEACRSWLNSPGHRRILLGGQFRSAGVAMVVGVDGQPVWFAQFE